MPYGKAATTSSRKRPRRYLSAISLRDSTHVPCFLKATLKTSATSAMKMESTTKLTASHTVSGSRSCSSKAVCSGAHTATYATHTRITLCQTKKKGCEGSSTAQRRRREVARTESAERRLFLRAVSRRAGEESLLFSLEVFVERCPRQWKSDARSSASSSADLLEPRRSDLCSLSHCRPVFRLPSDVERGEPMEKDGLVASASNEAVRSLLDERTAPQAAAPPCARRSSRISPTTACSAARSCAI
mmetsp:Transcript_32039/g.73354  ORF Transcript_32039/g.73354 Transcript_32039/m.73354 type:complete len:245 (-) Transcript_32039:190-924(-)